MTKLLPSFREYFEREGSNSGIEKIAAYGEGKDNKSKNK